MYSKYPCRNIIRATLNLYLNIFKHFWVPLLHQSRKPITVILGRSGLKHCQLKCHSHRWMKMEQATGAEPTCLSTVVLSPLQDVLHLLQDELRLNSWVKDYPFLLFFLFRPFNFILKTWEQSSETWSILFLFCWWQSQVSAPSLQLPWSKDPGDVVLSETVFSYRNDKQKQNFSVCEMTIPKCPCLQHINFEPTLGV